LKYKPQTFIAARITHLNTGMVFSLLWAVMFLLYLPAARAGFVTDFTGWLNEIRNSSFPEYINRTHFQAHSLYQFTQLVTWVFYRLFGANAWLWHLLFITLHVANATLIYVFCTRLLNDSGVVNGGAVSLGGAMLFCISPYISEVIVWEPSFHFLQGLLLIMLILTCIQKYVYTGLKKYSWCAIAVYLVSIFSLEVFYITPWLALALAVFYQNMPGMDKKLFYRVAKLFFGPMLLLFAGRLLVFRIMYGGWVSRIGSGAVATLGPASFGKPAKYLFHLLFMGRFLSDETRHAVYAFCDSGKGLVLFYSIVAVICIYIIARFRSMTGKGKVASLLFIYTLITLSLLIPLWFSDMLLVIFDRYTYFTGAFLYMLLAILCSSITIAYVRLGIITLFALANLRFTLLINRYWGKSAHIIHNLLYNLPDPGNRTLILLNLPESMNGIPMIGSEKESEYQLMHNLLAPGKKINTPVYDGLSYNMLTPGDGAHVTVLNDSTLRVTLNQWGTWWWYEGKGGYSYENKDYKLNMIDGGHFYELTLKKPAQNYLLLYEVGDQWNVVEMNKKGAQD
jgi:hypothetical protein